MPYRAPVLAGQFYADAPEALAASVDAFLAAGAERTASLHCVPVAAPMLLLPHAGHVYCGRIIGETLARVRPAERVILLCPGHTPEAGGLAVWPEGAWGTPLGPVPVDAELAGALLAQDAGYVADTRPHLREHAIEVLLPFLQRHSPGAAIVPVVVSARPDELMRAGQALAIVLRQAEDAGRPAMVIVSSDMHHFGDAALTTRLDERALAPLLALDPAGLYNTVVRERISMCGVQPATLALFAGRRLGLSQAELVAHTTSAEATGDERRVVGYAGVIMV